MTRRSISLADFVGLKRGYDLPTRQRGEGTVPILGSFGITGSHDVPKHPGPGVSIGRSGASIGVATYCPDPYWPLNTTLYVNDFKGNDPRFVYYVLDALDFADYNSGSAQPSLNRNYLAAIPIPEFDITEQAIIVAILGSIDDLIENNRRRIEVLEEMAQAIYREWFVHFRYPGHEDATFIDSPLGLIPEGWKPVGFGDLVDLKKKTFDPSEIADGSVLVGLEHIPRKRLTLDSWEQATEVGSRKATFSRGDILFGKIRPYFHKVSLAPMDGYCSSDAMVFRPKPSLEALATSIAFSDEFVNLASATANGTKMPRANWDVLADHEIPIPPPQLLEAFTRVFSPSAEQCAAMMFTNRHLSRIRDVLLPKLVTGEIDVSKIDLDALVEAAS